MKKYSSYIDSGADWLGRVPSHWKLGRLGSYVSLRGEKGSDKVFEPLSVTKNGVVAQLETAAKTDDGENRKVVRKGDIAINGRSDRKGSSGLADMDGSVSLINIVLKIDRGLHPKFAHHLIRSVAFQEEFYRWGRGIVADLWSTNYWDLKRIPTAIPPIEEQKAIASFIDSTLGDMDTAISAQGRMIELLKERRSSIITQAVTKGLDSKAKMKDSGVPWLGQVPAHWEVKKLKRAFSEISEKAKPGDEQLAATQKFGVISQSQFMKDQDQRLVLALKGTDNFKHLEKDDFVISLRAFEGGIERSNQSGCVSPAYTVLRSKGEVMPDFAARLLKTPEFISQISMTYDGIREGKAIKFKDAGPVPLPVPPAAEQSAITTFIDAVIFKLDSAIESQERMIELLKERRSAIITQAVTGQIDVR